ncbi:hypothetical protein [Stenotrophomonas sp. MMGLT7]|uniref:hypothetical protein n=1 Tax=Stenotrophomonas sp. MMGLT7 TaxID=2901227 RepID=UPI001E5B3FE5|nr:hypothetical protein [Stenotrophomonas sp. MMGLT7]MCD7098997.1 hypothetical protein [Stenotrophomonas sp. MMGLT7]
MTKEIAVVNPRVHDDELGKLRKNLSLKLWTKPHMSHINAYRSHSVGGQGLVLVIPKDENQELLEAFESGRDTWIQVERVDSEIRFRAFHLTQEYLDKELDEKRSEFAEEIRKPYRPRTSIKAWLRTIGDLPFEEGMVLSLVPESRDFYIRNLGHPVSFVSDRLKQTTHLTDGKTAKAKIIRAALSGYDASAVVMAQYSNRSLIQEDGVLKHHHVAEAVVTFTPRNE